MRGSAVHTQSDYALACPDASGRWNGPYQEWRHSGLAVAGHYSNGQPEDEWTFFYPNGRILKRGSYRAGLRQGEWRSYYENGRKLAEGAYRDDALNGRWTEWYETGVRKSQGAYQNGEEAGQWTFWHPNGRLDRAGNYRGRRIVPPRNASVPAESGKWTYWYDNGHKRMEGCFRDGLQVGLWTEWSPEGQVTSQKTFGPAGAATAPCN
jgi:antitoxin component YwqK of YwqJK toxin-antitoxin module